MANFLTELKLRDSLEHAIEKYLEEGGWGKMGWVKGTWGDAVPGAHPQPFGIGVTGNYYSAEKYKAPMAVGYKRSIGTDAAERYWSLWVCYKDSATEAGRQGYFGVFTMEVGDEKALIKIYKCEGATNKEIGENKYNPAAGDHLYLWVHGKKLELWCKRATGKLEALLICEDPGTPYTEGYTGFTGEGSDPSFTAFETGEETKPEPFKPATQRSRAGAPIAPLTNTGVGGGFAWSASELPAGLSINSETGEITGSPTTVQHKKVTLKATNYVGGGEAEFEWIIERPIPGDELIGSNVETYPTAENSSTGTIVGVQFIASGTGTLKEIELFTGATANTCTSVVMAVCADAGNKPEKVLGQATIVGAPGTEEWITATGLEAEVVQNQPYWLLFLNVGGTLHYNLGSAGSHWIESEKRGLTKIEEGTKWTALITTGPIAIRGLGSFAETALPAIGVRDQFPLNLLINGENMTFLVDEDFSFSNGDPGGYEAASFPIPMDLPTLQRGDPVRLDCGLSVAWEGRVKEIQRSLGNKTLVQCEGNRAKLKDSMTSMIYVDRDLTRWTTPSVERQRQITEESKGLGSFSPGFSTVLGESRPSLMATITGEWGAIYPRVEAWYDAGPDNVVAKIITFAHYSSPGSATTLGLTEADWKAYVKFFETAAAKPNEHQYSLDYPYPGGYEMPEGSEEAWRYVALQIRYEAQNAGTQGAEYLTAFGSVVVIGNHKLEDRGEGEFYSSDIVTRVIGEASGIGVGVIDPATAYKVRQAAYYTPVFYEKIVSDMAILMGWHWGVWESLTYLTGNAEPRLDFRPYPTEPTVYAWRQDCENLDLRENIENLYNRCVVTYTDVTGKEGSVEITEAEGEKIAPGSAGLLAAAGISRTLEVNAGVSTEESAKELGELQLILYEQRARVTGTATITAAIHDIGGADMPAWMLKAGIDLLRVPDLPCSDVWGAYNDLPISRVECTGGDPG